MNVQKLDLDVYDALKGRHHRDEDIEQMSPSEAFSEYCEWQGLHGWGASLMMTMKNLESAK